MAGVGQECTSLLLLLVSLCPDGSHWPFCVYHWPALLPLIGSALPGGRTMFAFAFCLGKSPFFSQTDSDVDTVTQSEEDASLQCSIFLSRSPKCVRNLQSFMRLFIYF